MTDIIILEGLHEYRVAIRPQCGCGRGMCPPSCVDHEVICSSSKNLMTVIKIHGFCVLFSNLFHIIRISKILVIVKQKAVNIEYLLSHG